MKEKTEVVVWKLPMVPQEKKLRKTTDSLVARANSFVIKSEDHFVASWALVLLIDAAMVTVGEMWDPFVGGLHKMHKMAIKLRGAFMNPLEGGKEHLLDIRKTYREDQEKIKAKADAAAAEALRKTQARELEKQAKSLEKQGQVEAALAVREHKFDMPLFINTAPAVPKQEGSVLTERWVYEIVDPDAVEREYCSPDDSLIGPVVRRLGDKAKISGIVIRLDKSEHSRTVA